MAAGDAMTDWKQHLRDYLALRHGLGNELADAARLLEFLTDELASEEAEFLTVARMTTWVTAPDAEPGSTVWQRRATAARGFARYLSGLEPRHELLPQGLVTLNQSWRVPFIYSPAQVSALMRDAGVNVRGTIPQATYPTLIGLLSCTGMRVGEAISLNKGDLCGDHTITIRNTKFGKTRQIPIDPATVAALGDYLTRTAKRRSPATEALLVSGTGRRLCYESVSETFGHIVDRCGVGQGSARRPTLHSFRHTFAVTTLTRWHRQGRDVGALLPVLATYLGHAEPRYTYWYLSATPELMAAAAAKVPPVTIRQEQ